MLWLGGGEEGGGRYGMLWLGLWYDEERINDKVRLGLSISILTKNSKLQSHYALIYVLCWCFEVGVTKVFRELWRCVWWAVCGGWWWVGVGGGGVWWWWWWCVGVVCGGSGSGGGGGWWGWCVGVVCGGGGVWGWWGWLPLDIDWSMDLDALRACIDRAMRLTYAGQSRVCERKKVCL